MAATIALRPVDAFGGLQDAAGQTVQRALIHADAIVSDFNTHHALPFASAQPDEAAVLLLADAMFDRVLDDRLHGQGRKPEIRGVDVIHHGEFIAEPHLFQRDVPFDMLQFHCERNRFRSGHGVRIVAHVCGEQAERLFGFVHIRVAHGLDGGKYVADEMRIDLTDHDLHACGMLQRFELFVVCQQLAEVAAGFVP